MVCSRNRSISFFGIKRWRSARDGRSNPRLVNRLTVFSDTPNISAVSRTLNAKRGRINRSLASLETGAGLPFELAVGISSISEFMVFFYRARRFPLFVFLTDAAHCSCWLCDLVNCGTNILEKWLTPLVSGFDGQQSDLPGRPPGALHPSFIWEWSDDKSASRSQEDENPAEQCRPDWFAR